MTTVNLSNGSTFATGLNPATTRQLVQGPGNSVGGTPVRTPACSVITPGLTGFDVVQSLGADVDSALQGATALAPFKLGIDDIYFIPLQYPETASI